MRTFKLFGLSAVCAMTWGAGQPAAAPCDPVGEIRFICDVISPEDFAVVPGGDAAAQKPVGSDRSAGQVGARGVDHQQMVADLVEAVEVRCLGERQHQRHPV